MTLDELRAAVADGSVDTVLLAIADMEGRLQGKRLTASHFLDEVLEHGAEAANYLLAVDVDMETVGGYAIGILGARLRRLRDEARPRDPAAGSLAAGNGDGARRPAVGRRQRGGRLPRQILRRQLARLAERGLIANAGTELEFIVYKTTYEEAWRSGYRDLDPANLYNVDYSLLGTARVEPLIRRIRNEMGAAGLMVENSKGECNFGQHEINFRYGEALKTCDEHVIYKNGTKEIAAQEEHSITFMAKVNELEGNSCHVHCSLAHAEGEDEGGNAFAAGPDDVRALPRRAADLHAGDDPDVRSLRQLLQALRRRLLRSDRGRLGPRQPHLRIARGRRRRGASVREPAPGRRRQPLSGAERDDRRRPARDRHRAAAGAGDGGQRLRLRCPPGSPPTSTRPAKLFSASEIGREAFGDEVVEHYLNHARVELDAHETAVTDWDKYRGFERL